MHKLGDFVVKRRWWIISGWLLAAGLLIALAPPISQIESNDQSSFLPPNYESVQAANAATQISGQKQTGPTDIVIFSTKSGQKMTAQAKQVVADAVKQLNAKHISGVAMVVTSQQQVAPNQTAQLATVIYDNNGDHVAAVGTIRQDLAELAKGTDLTAGVTGQVATEADTKQSADNALKIVEIGTILLVLLLPALIFGSPLAGLLPLVSVGLIYAMSNALISIAGHVFNFTLNQQLSVIFTVVLFGIGTDYILFLLFRYRERLRTGDHSRAAVSFALGRAGEAILSAALVVLASFMALFFADFGIFSSFAPGLAICVVTMMLASLTLVPALVSVIGEKVFWPSKAWMQKSAQPTISKKVGGVVSRHPAIVSSAVTVLLIGIAAFALNYRADFSTFAQPATGTQSAAAYDSLTKAFPAGSLNPTTIYVATTNKLTSASLQPVIDQLKTTNGVAQVSSTIAQDGKSAKLSVILKDDPYSAAAMDLVGGPVRQVAHRLNNSDTKAYVGGTTSIMADVKAVTNRDLRVIFPIAAVFIFVILAVLLRSLVAPILLLLCVSLGFVATLGTTTLIFQTIGGHAGLVSFIPLFLYIFVVAIGTDYNILTMTRLREEVREGNHPRLAADLTVEHSSATVVAAGTILAATFGSLLLGRIDFLTQMGASIAIGVMLSAFLIAPFLIPSLTALVGYKIWWPSRKLLKNQK